MTAKKKSQKDLKIEELTNLLKKVQADFENYRKRIEKEFQEVAQRINEKLIANLLNVLDDLERGIETGKTTKKVGALLEGVEMIKSVHNIGTRRIEEN